MVTVNEIMRIAALRDELVTLHQLRKHGLSRDTVAHLVHSRVLTPVFRGVYSVTPGPIDDARRAIALCLAVPVGVLSHQTAGAHWQLRRAPRGMLDLTIRAPQQARLPGAHERQPVRAAHAAGQGCGRSRPPRLVEGGREAGALEHPARDVVGPEAHRL